MELITKYTVEYIDDLETFKKVWDGKHPAPWMLWKKREFLNVCEAMTFYLLHYVADDYYDIKISEEIIVDGIVEREEYLEFEPTLAWNLSNAVNRDRQQRIDSLARQYQYIENYLEDYEAFLTARPAIKQIFDEFRSSMERLKHD